MKKNVILAVVLSTIVVVVSLWLQAFVLSKSSNDNEEISQKTESVESKEESSTEEKAVTKALPKIEEEITEVDQNDIKIYKINTGIAEIILTNQGGDLVSYQLSDKTDKHTGKGVQLADFSTSYDERTITVDGVQYLKLNRACAVSFDVEDDELFFKPIENKIFAVNADSDEKYSKFLNGESNYNISFETKLNKNGKEFIFAKKYSFSKNDYMFKLDIVIKPVSAVESKLNYTIRTAPRIGPYFDAKDKNEKRQFIGYDGKDDDDHDMIKWNEGHCGISNNVNSKWVAIASKYFISFMVPYGDVASKIDQSWYTTRNNDDNNETLNAQSLIRRGGIDFSNGNVTTDTYYFYFGPRTESELKKYKYQGNNAWGVKNLDLTEAAPSSWLGWLETVLKWLLQLIQKIVVNWGASIIMMTFLIKLIMFPFTRKQSLSTIKMKELQPKIQEIQLKYKDNPQKMQQQMGKLYKESGYNPLSGCLPLIVQFFILFAMYNLFNNYYEFYGSSFIPGWIDDLSSGDSVYTLGFNIPFLGNEIRLLPIIYLASQLLYGKITGTGSGGGVNNIQMKIMMYGMPIIFFFIFYNFPSGLILYWTASNIFQMIQQVIINQMVKSAEKKSSVANR